MRLIRWFTGTRYGAMAFGVIIGAFLIFMSRRQVILGTLQDITSYILVLCETGHKRIKYCLAALSTGVV